MGSVQEMHSSSAAAGTVSPLLLLQGDRWLGDDPSWSSTLLMLAAILEPAQDRLTTSELCRKWAFVASQRSKSTSFFSCLVLHIAEGLVLIRTWGFAVHRDERVFDLVKNLKVGLHILLRYMLLGSICINKHLLQCIRNTFI